MFLSCLGICVFGGIAAWKNCCAVSEHHLFSKAPEACAQTAQ